MDESARQLELVRLTFRNGLRNCVHWQGSALSRASRDAQFLAIGAREVIDRLFDWVNSVGGLRPAVANDADSAVPYDYLFEVVVADIDGIANGLYITMALKNADKDYPEVNIVSCHTATFPRGPR